VSIDSERLQQLVDDEDIDAVLALVTVEQIAEAWCRYTENGSERSFGDPDWWAVELLMEPGVAARRDLHRRLLVALVDKAEGDVLAEVGAGPLESFVSDDEDDLTWLEAECSKRPAMRQALSNVWCALDVSSTTLIRLDEAAGAPLTRPRPREEWPAEVLAVEMAEARLVQVAGPQWWLLDDLDEEQSTALAEHRAAEEALLNRLRWTDGDSSVTS
jgi:hypothetical protein